MHLLGIKHEREIEMYETEPSQAKDPETPQCPERHCRRYRTTLAGLALVTGAVALGVFAKLYLKSRMQTAISPSRPPQMRTGYVAVRNVNSTPGCLSSSGPCKGQG